METTYLKKNVRRRKFLLVLPFLVLPFLTGAFWALGGGKGTPNQRAPHQPGLNAVLPEAHFKGETAESKLSFYDLLAADSARLRAQMKNDPYVDLPSEAHFDSLPEQQVNQKLAQIQAALQETTTTTIPKQTDMPDRYESDHQIERLEQLVQGVSPPTGTTATADPQMEQLSGMLDKILDIQHPERLQLAVQGRSSEQQPPSYTVSRVVPTASVGLLDTHMHDEAQENYFLGMPPPKAEREKNTIQAVVHEAQVITSGAVVKLRLLQPVFVNGQLIPKDNFIFGTATLRQERLDIDITAVRVGDFLIPIRLEVFDLDGLRGIYIPGSITRDVSKQSADNALQSVALNALNPTVGTQATAAGIETAKNLLSKKIKLVKVQLTAGYKVLLNNHHP